MSEYGLASLGDSREIAAPDLPYRPPMPAAYRPRLGLIGAGGISEYHLRAYRAMGLEVAAICNRTLAKAVARRDEFFPEAEATDDYRRVLARDDIAVVDITPHPAERVPIVEAALRAGKHVLSQKPFATDLADGARLADLADECGVKLAVNQNGRWAPHFAWMREAIRAGLIGEVSSIDVSMQWDHTWTAGTPFEEIRHLVLYDFAIHWFDMVCAMVPDQMPERVFASVRRAGYQRVKPPFLACAAIDFPAVQARLCFNAHVAHGQEDRTVICGENGTLRSSGPRLNEQSVALWTAEGCCRPALEGDWFTSGFQGTMGELLCAIEEDRAPLNNARDNLRSLALCFAAVRSADSGEPVRL
ncbi:MAG: Gfo/Idh/MocA family oxidoreductase [Verrucomicrobiales bacterium]